jgi:cell division transport system ATP-binding protein
MEVLILVKFVSINLNRKTEVDLNLNSGEFCYLSYENENKKNLLLQIMTKVFVPKNSKVIIEGEDFLGAPKAGYRNLLRRVGITYGDYKFIGCKTIFENLRYYLELRGYTHEEVDSLSNEVLEFFKLDNKKNDFIDNLSQKELHYFSLSRALSTEPSYLILDEFHKGLEEAEIKKIFLLLEELSKKGIGILYITNDSCIWEKYPKELKILGKGVKNND